MIMKENDRADLKYCINGGISDAESQNLKKTDRDKLIVLCRNRKVFQMACQRIRQRQNSLSVADVQRRIQL